MKCPKCEADNPETSRFCADCGTQLDSFGDISVTKTLETPAKGLAIGLTFAGRYQIMEELGRGGMGAVYKALDTRINEEVAIKLLRPEIAADEKTLERFSNELRLARKIAHKNVCKMYHLDKEEDTSYISMEYLEGQDLKKMIWEKEKLSAEEAIEIAQQVCEGLIEAHRLGVVHRDLKPHNIMIDKEGQAKIMDFGIARSMEAPGVTQTGVIIGTPDYISPEQAEGQEADHRSDIYSLGVILYEMATGSVPFKGDTALSVALKHKAQLPLDPRKRNPAIPDDLNRLILICMEKDRNRRYQTAKDLLDDLRNIEHGLPLGTRIRPHRQTFVSSLIRKKLLIPALILVVAIIAVTIWQLLPPPFVREKPLVAILHFQNNSGNESLDQWEETLPFLLNIDLSQSMYIDVVTSDNLQGILKKLDLLEVNSFSRDELSEIARQSGATHVMRGILTKSEDKIVLSSTLQETRTMSIIGTNEVEAAGEEYFHSMVDELTQKIKLNLNLSQDELAKDIDEEIGMISSPYPEALKHYMEGERLHTQLQQREAIPFFEKAIEIDPEFAMAYRMLSAIYTNRGSTRSRNYIRKAYELREKVSARERYIIDASYYALNEESLNKAIELYKKIVDFDPDDYYGNHGLALAFYHSGELDLAIDHFERLIQNGTEQRIVYYNTAHYLSLRGDYQKAEDYLKRYNDKVSEQQRFRGELLALHIFQRKFEFALQEAENLYAKDPGGMTLALGYIYNLRDEYETASQYYQKVLKKDNSQDRYDIFNLYISQGKVNKAIEIMEEAIQEKRASLYDRVVLGALHLRIGNPKRALRVFEEAIPKGLEKWEPRMQRELLFPLALAYVETGKMEKAEEIMGEIRRLTPDAVRKIIQDSSYYTHVNEFYYMGNVALQRKEYVEAAKYLERAVAALKSEHFAAGMFTIHAWYMDTLAEAYQANGDIEKAIGIHKRIQLLTYGRIAYGDIYAKSYYKLGKIYEQKEEKELAIENYEKFLDLWKDADPGIAEVEDAKKRLAEL